MSIRDGGWRLRMCLLGLLAACLCLAAGNPVREQAKFREIWVRLHERALKLPEPAALIQGAIAAMIASASVADLTVTDIYTPKPGESPMLDELAAFDRAFQAIGRCARDRVDSAQLMIDAVKGMVGALHDPYSVYLPVENMHVLENYLAGESPAFAGIGVRFEFRDGACQVVTPIETGPAYRAGIRARDVIEQVDGKPVENEVMVQELIRGKPGTPVRITVRREGAPQTLDYVMNREVIMMEELHRQMLDERIGYLLINSFNERTGVETETALNYLAGKGLKGLVLDLRGNAGGLLTAALEVSELLLPAHRLITFTQGRSPATRMDYYTRGTKPFTDFPMMVLVDDGTASAAEIVTGAVRDNQRATIVGRQTFGKGTVQEVIQLEDQSALKLTVACYYTPKGDNINRVGIPPDVVAAVNAEENQPPPSGMLYLPLSRRLEIDPALAKAIELLNTQLQAGKEELP